jgi:hypothetical protein
LVVVFPLVLLVAATGCDAGTTTGKGLGLLLAAVLLLAGALRTVAGDLPLQNKVALLVLLSGIRAGFLEMEDLWSGGDSFAGTQVVPRIAGSVATLVLARGVARRGLQSIRGSPRFGYWLLGMSTVLGAAADLLLSLCLPGGATVPPAVSVLWAATGLVAGLPWFLSKRPVPETVDRSPLVLWSLAMAGIGVLLKLQGRPAGATIAGALALAAWLPEAFRRRTGGV